MSGAGVALLPCPFCGTPDPCLERSYVDDASQDSGWRVLDAYDVTCLSLDCGTVLEMPGAADVVAAAWNRRAANAAPIRAGDVLTHDDHARGCAGREYACTCGYDDRLTAALTALRAENAALVADNARLMGMLEGEPENVGAPAFPIAFRDVTEYSAPIEQEQPMTRLEISPDFHDDTKGRDGARFRFQFAVTGTIQTGVIYVTAPTLEAAVKIAGKRAGAEVVTLHRKGFGV